MAGWIGRLARIAAAGLLGAAWLIAHQGRATAGELEPVRSGALAYLQSLAGTPGYLAPGEIDPRFTIALYVNAATSGPNQQRMWVLHRDRIGGAWRLAMWDEAHWKKKLPAGGEPAYSWLVSTGRKYPGDRLSGPTPTGVFGLDERRGRIVPGYAGPGMINAMWIDLHYDGGRRSGVAFHGTTPGAYRRLGTVDSHGCIRMHQRNASALLKWVTGRDKALSEDQRFGEVPRFWQRESGNARYGYTRSGHGFPVEVESMRRRLAANDIGSSGPIAVSGAVDAPEADLPAVLTKDGYRVIAVIFDN